MHVPISCTVDTSFHNTDILVHKSCINVWRCNQTSIPTFTLVGEGLFTTLCTFSNPRFQDIIICGSEDGMLQLWDLRQTSTEVHLGANACIKSEVSKQRTRVYRACYQSEFIADISNDHLDSIIEIASLERDKKATELSCQIISLDKLGTLILW